MSSSRSCQSSSNVMTYTFHIITSIPPLHPPSSIELTATTPSSTLQESPCLRVASCTHSLPSRPMPRLVLSMLFRFTGTTLRMQYTRPFGRYNSLPTISHTVPFLMLRGCTCQDSHRRLPLQVYVASYIGMLYAGRAIGLFGGA